MASIADAVQKAQEAAKAIAATAETPTQGGQLIEGRASPSGQVTTFTKPSMSNVAAATSVIPRNTAYLKVNEFGIRIGKNKEFLTGFKAKILVHEDKGFMVKHTLRFGNPAQYISTFDGVVADKGGSWHDALLKVRMADPSVEPYHSVDVVLTVAEPVKMKEETLPVGLKLGFNSSKTNFSEWTDFYSAVAEAGLLGQEVDVQIGHREINHGGNTWGVVTFELL